MNDQEQNIYNNLAIEKLKADIEILTNKREHLRNSIDTIGKEIKQFLDNKSKPETLRREFYLNGKKNII